MRILGIYALCDPRTGCVRYVGCSKQPWKRFTSHCSGDAKPNVRQWVKSLKKAHLVPVLAVLYWTDDPTLEGRVISEMRKAGYPLLNERIGGYLDGERRESYDLSSYKGTSQFLKDCPDFFPVDMSRIRSARLNAGQSPALPEQTAGRGCPHPSA